jgi:murein DD-endopeptidase MepM/ murein hydrolase activator NlpD
MAINLGVRVDTGGAGWFLASRGDRRHHGLDLLAPVGTEVVAVCTGRFRTGTRDPFGRWVQTVCRLPDELVGGRPAFVSILYAHLGGWSKESVEFADVQASQPVGRVGRTGNASDKRIRPHLHVEMAVHGRVWQAEADEHPVRKRPAEAAGDTEAALLLERRLESRCATRPVEGSMRRGTLLDPFVLLTCLGVQPETARSEPALDDAARPFAEHYLSTKEVIR